MSTISLGDLVEGIGVATGSLYQGRLTSFAHGGYNPRITITEVKERKQGSAAPGSSASIINMKKVEEMVYVKNLVGPKPEPVEEPKFVAPFSSDGRNVVDANRKVVARIVHGGYTASAYRSELPMAEAYELARVFAEALSEKFAVKAEDSKSPF